MNFKASGGGGGKNFLRLKSGERVKGVFRGEPYDFKQHWIDSKSTVCTGEGCPVCKQGHKPNFRFRLNFVMNENGAYVAKIFEQGWTVYETLKSLHESDYDLEHYLVTIARMGDGTNTNYSIVPAPNGLLNAQQETAVAAVALLPLEHGPQPGPLAQSEDDIGF